MDIPIPMRLLHPRVTMTGSEAARGIPACMIASLRPTDADLARIIGSSVRSTRLASGWTQQELARRLATTQSTISRLETGVFSCVDLRLASAAFALLGIRLVVDGATLGLAARREQRDFVHARCAAYVARQLRRVGWEVRLEVEIGNGRYRGWIDLIAFRPVDRCLLTIEIKTEIDDVGRIQRTLGWYQREAHGAGRRNGWLPRSATCALLVLSTTQNDIRVRSNVELLREAFPGRARDFKAWIGGSSGPLPPASLAMIDPRSRRSDWLRPTIADGRRSPAPYADYRAAADSMRGRSRACGTSLPRR